MFEGLRSRWITPFWCAAWVARASVAASSAACREGCGVPEVVAARLPLPMNSIVRYGRESLSPTS